MRRAAIYVSTSIMFVLLACAPSAKVTTEAEVDALRALDNDLSKAVTNRDLEQIVSFYAEDATLLPTAEPSIHGKDAIRDEWKHILSIPDFSSKSTLLKVDISDSRDLAYTTGTYVATMMGEDGRPVQEPGKWVTIWRRQPTGKWRIIVDTYNTDVPPPDHK